MLVDFMSLPRSTLLEGQSSLPQSVARELLYRGGNTLDARDRGDSDEMGGARS